MKLLRKELEAAGVRVCMDNSCMFGAPGGMGTNSGCRCIDHNTEQRVPTDVNIYIQRLAMVMRNLAKEIEELEDSLVEMQESYESGRDED